MITSREATSQADRNPILQTASGHRMSSRADVELHNVGYLSLQQNRLTSLFVPGYNGQRRRREVSLNSIQAISLCFHLTAISRHIEHVFLLLTFPFSHIVLKRLDRMWSRPIESNSIRPGFHHHLHYPCSPSRSQEWYYPQYLRRIR